MTTRKKVSALDCVYGPRPICLDCSRLGRVRKGNQTCAAFPQGIPDRIYVGVYDHRKPYKGDKGIRFEVAHGKESSLER
jgi:hypothetical protein